MATYNVRVEPLGRDVACRDDQPILDACLREGIWLPHACTHGTCGTCKTRVLEGAVEHGESSMFALMDFEREEAALLCTASPRSDVVVEGDVELEPGVDIHPVRDFVGRVTEVTELAPDVRRVSVALEEDLRFNPGQYVLLRLPGGDERRSYSLANPPSEPRRLELHIKRAPGGRCTDGWIFSTLAVEDRVELCGPYGRFSLRPARAEPMLMLAGGTGLAPLKGIIRHVLESGLDRRMVLYHGVGTRADLYDRDYFEGLAAAHPDRLTPRRTPAPFRGAGSACPGPRSRPAAATCR